MGRLDVFLKPIEILNFPPQILFPRSVVVALMLGPSLVLEAILLENKPVAVFNDGLAGDKDLKSRIISVMDSELMAV